MSKSARSTGPSTTLFLKTKLHTLLQLLSLNIPGLKTQDKRDSEYKNYLLVTMLYCILHCSHSIQSDRSLFYIYDELSFLFPIIDAIL